MYYRQTALQVIGAFEATYNKLLTTIETGKEPTPADLYKLDKFWQLQSQLRQELNKLGEKEIVALTKQFEIQFYDIYYSFALKGSKAFNTLDTAAVNQMLKSVWVADNKTYSKRVWDNTEALINTLNEELIHCVAAGKKTTDLKKKLQERFNVSFHRADTLVKTEMAHIQTEAAKQRYKDYGIKQVQVWADEDERRCEECGKLHQKIYNVGEHIPVPRHPRCRCCVLPVVDIDDDE